MTTPTPRPEWFTYLVTEVARRILQSVTDPLETADTHDLLLKSEEDPALVEAFVEGVNAGLRAQGYTQKHLVWVRQDDAILVSLHDTPGHAFALVPTTVDKYTDAVWAQAYFLVLTFQDGSLVVHNPIGHDGLLRARALQENGLGRFCTTMELELPRIKETIAHFRQLLLSPLDRADLDMIERLLASAELLLAGDPKRTHLIARAFVALVPLAHSRDIALGMLPVGQPQRSV